MKRALVVGAQIEGLRGVETDASAMTAMLEARGFEVDRRTAERATRAGILAGYDALIDASRAGDAAVVYYSGHGFYASIATARLRAWQCIAPTDIREGGPEDWRGISSWELSIKQAQLAARTTNVTVILDCCHAAQMSRDAAVRAATPRALPHPVKLGFEAHLQALRRSYRHAFELVEPVGHPDVVRLVACGATESAFEVSDAAGEVRGVFTAALLEVLREVGEAPISWSAVGEAVAVRVQRSYAWQRPEVEGPGRRRPFSLIEEDDRDRFTIRATEGGYLLPAGRLAGVAPGDVFGVMPVGSQRYQARTALAELEVTEVQALTARMRQLTGSKPLPIDAVAMPIRKHAVRHAVALDVPAGLRRKFAQAIAATSTLRLAAPGEAGAVATLKLANDALTIEDAGGPLFPAAPFPDALMATIKGVVNLGVAQGVRELEGEHGVLARELEIELGTVDGGLGHALPEHGGALGLRDRIYVKVHHRGRRRLFVHVFNVGVRGKVTLLTSFAPSGVALDRGDPPFVLGQAATGDWLGLGLSWPSGLPRQTFPRLDELFVIVTTAKTCLRSLETREVPPTTRERGSKLGNLLAQLQDGLSRDVADPTPIDGFLVKRLSYLLHPRDAAMASGPFEIDDNPAGHAAAREPRAWIVPGADAGAPTLVPAEGTAVLAVRLAELVVERTHALLAADVRVDALICTRSADGGPVAWTQRFTGIKDGQRLPLDNGLLFLGPVRDFVDITLWVSRDTKDSLALAGLLAERASSPAFKDAAGALLLAAGTLAAPWVAAVGASAVLARMAYELVLGVAGTSIGLYRTSFLARERFGAGRLPAQGRYRAQGFSFSLAIEEVVPAKQLPG